MKLSEMLHEFNAKYGFAEDYTKDKRVNRYKHIKEEVDELKVAIESGDDVAIIDALCDIIYLSVGSMTLENWDFERHFKAVHDANMAKVRGVNPNRPDSGGFDVYKPEGWVAPEATHALILAE